MGPVRATQVATIGFMSSGGGVPAHREVGEVGPCETTIETHSGTRSADGYSAGAEQARDGFPDSLVARATESHQVEQLRPERRSDPGQHLQRADAVGRRVLGTQRVADKPGHRSRADPDELLGRDGIQTRVADPQRVQ